MTDSADDFPGELLIHVRFERDWALPALPRSIRAKAMLKALLRGHAVRCIGISDGAGRELPPVPAELDPS
jgi:hypothetical protein